MREGGEGERGRWGRGGEGEMGERGRGGEGRGKKGRPD